jgi:hypothetical protein
MDSPRPRDEATGVQLTSELLLLRAIARLYPALARAAVSVNRLHRRSVLRSAPDRAPPSEEEP